MTAVSRGRRRPRNTTNAKPRSGVAPRPTSPAAAVANEMAARIAALIAAEKDLTAQNARLSRENEVLKSWLAKIERALGESPDFASTEPSAAAGRRAPGARELTVTRRTQRTVSNPAISAKRRASLAKAREALAAKRAAMRAV
jgi:hypothetical protein